MLICLVWNIIPPWAILNNNKGQESSQGNLYHVSIRIPPARLRPAGWGSFARKWQMACRKILEAYLTSWEGHCPIKYVKGCHCWAQSWNFRETVVALPSCKPTHFLELGGKASHGEWSRVFSKSWLKKKMMFPVNSKNRGFSSFHYFKHLTNMGDKTGSLQNRSQQASTMASIWVTWAMELSVPCACEGSLGNDRLDQQGGE